MPQIIKNKIDVLEYREGQAGTVEIYDIVVKTERGKGIGRQLVNELIEETKAKRVYAFCRSYNKNAHLFYEKLGFKGYDLPNFYEDSSAKIYIYETSQ